MTDQPGDLGAVWNRVIADLSGASAESGSAALSPQQRAFLRLTRPLGLLDGTALLAAPSEFAKDAIERILRRPISDALGRHLGVSVNLAVVVDASAASGGTEVPDPPGFGSPRSPIAPASSTGGSVTGTVPRAHDGTALDDAPAPATSDAADREDEPQSDEPAGSPEQD
ncbi:MAG: chromosomal replication initiation protein DnaA, partial [Actinomycetota bacterium]|nr:chromosomal replication initiation protein DnaA [Actinomycetota bacterium]